MKFTWRKPLIAVAIREISAHKMLNAEIPIALEARFYQEFFAEIYDLIQESVQSEKILLHSILPFALAKLYATQISATHPVILEIAAYFGVPRDHESHSRRVRFVNCKVTFRDIPVNSRLMDKIAAGNLDGTCYRHFERDYVCAEWLVLVQKKETLHVTAKNRSASARYSCDLTCAQRGLKLNDDIMVDPSFILLANQDVLFGDTINSGTKRGSTVNCTFGQLVIEGAKSDMGYVKHKEKL